MQKYIFKSIVLLAFLCLSCSDIARDNILDPGNPDSYQEPVVLVEAFVNTNNSVNFNEMAIEGLNSLDKSFKDDLVIVEYHRNTSQYADPYHLSVNEDLYSKYVQQNGGVGKGAPDIFVNGSEKRVSGASSQQGVIDRLSPIISNGLAHRTYFIIEPKSIKMNGLNVSVELLVARLGILDARDIKIKAVFIKNFSAPHERRVVIHMEKSTTIPKISAGEIHTQKFSNMTMEYKPDAVVFVVTSADESEVFQSKKVEIE